MKKITLTILIMVITSISFAEESNFKLLGWWKVDTGYVAKVIDEMKKDLPDSDKKMLERILPRVQKMAEKQTIIIDEKNIISVYGDRERTTPYQLMKVVGNEYTLKVGTREKTFSLIGSRLVETRELNGKRPAMYMSKLSAVDIKKVKEIIATAKRPPAATDSVDKRILFLVYKASPEQQKMLLKTQPDLVKLVHPSRNETALSLAISANKEGLVKLLIDSGANIEQKNSQGNNMLFVTVSSRTVNRVLFDTLVNKGLDVKSVNDRGETILITAVDKSTDIEFIKYLLSLGLDINHKTKFDDTALAVALKDGKADVVALLIKNGADISVLGSSIDKLVRNGDLKALKLLADNEIYADKYGKTAIMNAVSSRKRSVKSVIPQLLSMFKSTINAKDTTGANALFYTRDLATIKQLIAAGCDSKVNKQFNESLLHYHSGSPVEVLKFLIDEQKLSVDTLNTRKNTPLMLALSRCEDVENAEFLLSKGANINHVGFNQGTPLSWAICNDSPKAQVELLLNKGVKLNSSPLEVIKECIFKDKPELLTLLVKHGLNIQTDKKQQYTPFWYAIYADKLEMAKLLITLGADPKVKNATNKSALDIATEFKKEEFMNLFFK